MYLTLQMLLKRRGNMSEKARSLFKNYILIFWIPRLRYPNNISKMKKKTRQRTKRNKRIKKDENKFKNFISIYLLVLVNYGTVYDHFFRQFCFFFKMNLKTLLRTIKKNTLTWKKFCRIYIYIIYILSFYLFLNCHCNCYFKICWIRNTLDSNFYLNFIKLIIIKKI